jgi:hypothetical protein
MFALIVVIVLYNILAGQLTGEMTGFADQYVNNPTDVGAFMLKGMSPIVVSIIGAFLLTKAEHLAQDLVGGGSSGAGGFASSMSGQMSGAAKAVGGKVAGKAAGAVKGAAGAVLKEMRKGGGGGRSSPGSSFLNAASNLNTGMRNRGGK